jgi:fused signal recognition particle receptor
MLAACDTFRAAAIEQLQIWGQRTGCPVVASDYRADAAAVAFDAVHSAVAKKVDLLLLDTAGRQHTKVGLMDELAKIRRTVGKACAGAPHEVWLVVEPISTSAMIFVCRRTKYGSTTAAATSKRSHGWPCET